MTQHKQTSKVSKYQIISQPKLDKFQLQCYSKCSKWRPKFDHRRWKWKPRLFTKHLVMSRRNIIFTFFARTIVQHYNGTWYCKQELSYRKQIARQLHTQFVKGISVTLKSTLRVTQGHWKRNHWIDYTRLTITWTLNIIVTLKCGSKVTQNHWKWYHLKVWVQFPTFSYPNPNPRVRGQGHWKWRRSIDHMRLSIGPPL